MINQIDQIDQDAVLTSVPAPPSAGRAQTMLSTFLGMGFSLLAFLSFLTYSVLLLGAWRLIPVRWIKLLAANANLVMIVVVTGVAIIALLPAIYRDRQKRSAAAWQKFDYWTTTIVRYFLAYIFLTYGLAKVFHNQFTTPLSVMDTRLADISGFDLTWRFFGYSYAYALFIAVSQVLCAVLLFFRRTTTLGALILLPIISNIVFVNFAFGIPVKLFSSLFLLMALFLLLPEWRRFKALLWDNTPIGPPAFPVAYFHKSGRLVALKAAVILILIGIPLFELLGSQSAVPKTTTPLAGTWSVEQYKANGQVQPASNPASWQKFYVENDRLIEIRSGPHTSSYFSTFDNTKHTVTITLTSKQPFFAGAYQIAPDGTLTLDGQDPKHAKIEVTLTRVKNAD